MTFIEKCPFITKLSFFELGLNGGRSHDLAKLYEGAMRETNIKSN
jgi:hypothetical protein